MNLPALPISAPALPVAPELKMQLDAARAAGAAWAHDAAASTPGAPATSLFSRLVASLESIPTGAERAADIETTLGMSRGASPGMHAAVNWYSEHGIYDYQPDTVFGAVLDAWSATQVATYGAHEGARRAAEGTRQGTRFGTAIATALLADAARSEAAA